MAEIGSVDAVGCDQRELLNADNINVNVNDRTGAGDNATVEQDITVSDHSKDHVAHAGGFIIDADVADKVCKSAAEIVADAGVGVRAEAFGVLHTA